MKNQQVNHPKQLSHAVSELVEEGSRKRLQKAFYLPTANHPDHYISSGGSPCGDKAAKDFPILPAILQIPSKSMTFRLRTRRHGQNASKYRGCTNRD
jgi:hypothetical protein